MNICPFCKSNEVQAGEPSENASGRLTSTLVCLDCGNAWEENAEEAIYRCLLRGGSFIKHRRMLSKSDQGKEALLVRDPTNRFDSNAILVCLPASDIEQPDCAIGYIPREAAGILAPINDAGLLEFHAKIDKVIDQPRHEQEVYIEIRMTAGIA